MNVFIASTTSSPALLVKSFTILDKKINYWNAHYENLMLINILMEIKITNV